MFVARITQFSPEPSFNHIRLLASCRARIPNVGHRPTLSKYYYSSTSTIEPKVEATITSHDQSSGIYDNLFSDSENWNKAKDLWKLDSLSYANIIYPNGRSEITEKSKKIKEDRIVGGFRRLSPIENRTLPEWKDQKTPTHNFSSVSHQISGENHEEPIPLWKKHKLAIKKKLLGKAWNPQRKLTSTAMDEVRYLHKQFPDTWTTPKLAEHYNVASESIVKILKSNFKLSSERIAEQDNKKSFRKKLNVQQDVSKIKAARQALWMKQKAERDTSRKAGAPISTPIKLGAPTRKIS